jgi:octaheme c-type cytochrome (tetrathionate reductase family)
MAFRKLLPRLALVAALLPAPTGWANPAPTAAPLQPSPMQSAPRAATTSTADHSKFEILKKPFASGPEVTRACLSCHTEAARQVQKTKHWTWEFMNPETKQRLGKKHVINNFCTAVPSNYEFCTACHVGYGWKDKDFDFTAQDNVDCLVCHDTTGTYRKLPGLAGHPPYKDMEYPPHSGKMVKAPDLGLVARNVGKSSRANCGACHFYGGGGDAVKHGDLDSSMRDPGKYLDAHMAKDGLNFSCGTCHATAGHVVPGSRYAPTATDDKAGVHMRGKKDANPATCQACHGTRPHPATQAKLNDHTHKLACQTCHIPEFARGGIATKMSWDWSTAGRLDKDGKPIKLKDSAGRDAYDSKKGDFRYEANVIPEYIWFNGQVNYTLRDTKLDPGQVIRINRFEGSPDDGRSKVWPVKVFRGKQPYDTATNTLLIPHTYGGEGDDAAFWSNFNWDKALEAGMKAAGGSFSGQYGFVSTEMSWPITHMVAPKDDALTCQQCHGANGRLDKVPGLYMPGRDANPWLDRIGWGVALLTLLGVLAHGGARLVMARRGQGGH